MTSAAFGLRTLPKIFVVARLAKFVPAGSFARPGRYFADAFLRRTDEADQRIGEDVLGRRQLDSREASLGRVVKRSDGGKDRTRYCRRLGVRGERLRKTMKRFVKRRKPLTRGKAFFETGHALEIPARRIPARSVSKTIRDVYRRFTCWRCVLVNSLAFGQLLFDILQKVLIPFQR